MRSKLYLALVASCLGCCAFPPSQQQYPAQNYQGQGYSNSGYSNQGYSGYSGSSAYPTKASAYPPPPAFSGQASQYAPQTAPYSAPQTAPYSAQQPFSAPQQFQQPTSPYGLGAGTSQSWQQQQAARWDPYADVYAGPEIVGARPREFNRPFAEPFRGQGFRDTRWPF